MIQSELSELFEHPIFKALLAAVVGLLATPTFLIAAILMFWTLNLFAEILLISRRKDLGLLDFDLIGFYTRIALHIFLLTGLTILANLTGGHFIQLYGFTIVCGTEFFRMLKFLYGPEKAAELVRDLGSKVGLDISIIELEDPTDNNADAKT